MEQKLPGRPAPFCSFIFNQSYSKFLWVIFDYNRAVSNGEMVRRRLEHRRATWRDLGMSNLLLTAGAAPRSNQRPQGFIQPGADSLQGKRLNSLRVLGSAPSHTHGEQPLLPPGRQLRTRSDEPGCSSWMAAASSSESPRTHRAPPGPLTHGLPRRRWLHPARGRSCSGFRPGPGAALRTRHGPGAAAAPREGPGEAGDPALPGTAQRR